ncbi:MarR family transcriptional regulator [Janibacter limosus]|uniref:MarR family transcriptional regulator n=1 Tax=Janibacter limosus TaxID=53458 RepID=A0AC61U2A9_9MICO|nr:MarR family transcriptional regulator [Janibacter limosus]UUZ44161.1 MarR family transcriptional regulator [Janibacter limosus]
MTSRHDPSDDVDAIVEAWRRERPDLDVEPLHVFSRVSRLARLLDLDRTTAFARHELEGWEFDVLSALRRAGEPYELSPGRLVRETLVTSGTMTNRIDRLATKGWVERLPSPTDRRGVIVRLTKGGQAAVDSAMADLLTREGELPDDMAPAERDALTRALKRLLAPFEA